MAMAILSKRARRDSRRIRDWSSVRHRRDVCRRVTGETLARVEVQSSPDGVTYSPVQR
jgi:hypothetical protein